MYKDESLTLKFPEFELPFGGFLDPNNRWVKKAALIPWPLVESEYKKNLSGSQMGCPATPARMAFAALVIKEDLKLSDRETVEQIRENPYLQFFVGLEGFQTEEPFDASMMVYFRKRFPIESMNRINEGMVMNARKDASKPSKDSDDSPPKDLETSSGKEKNADKPPQPNQGKLLLDATCTPADIRYPTDLSLLNEAREKTETIIDRLHAYRPKGSQKPRTYRRKARKAYLAVAKKKTRSHQLIRKAIRQQLGYVRRNLRHIETLSQQVSLGVLKRWLYRDLLVISELYRQQKIMYEQKQKRIDDRIVSIWFPYVRPIKRGKPNAETEFGAKVDVSVVNGFVFAERVQWNNFNEGTDLIPAIKTYHRRFGYYPESVHVDKIYRTQDNLAYCRRNGIRLSGPPLGRPPKDLSIRREQQKLVRQDELDRITVEGKFGQGKRRFGLARIMAKLAETSTSVIGLNLFVMNLDKIFCLGSMKGFFLWIVRGIMKAFMRIQAFKRTICLQSGFHLHYPNTNRYNHSTVWMEP